MILKIKELKDADFNLVEIKENKPYCKLHGAMNKFTEDGIWRCCTTYKIEDFKKRTKFKGNNCKAGCEEK